MKPGDVVSAFGEEFVILDIKPRNDWAKEGRFEPKDVELLGSGIIARNIVSNKKEYFYDLDVDYVNGQSTLTPEMQQWLNEPEKD